MQTQEQLLRLLLQKQVDIKNKNEQIKQLQIKLTKAQLKVNRVQALEVKVKKLEKIIEKMENMDKSKAVKFGKNKVMNIQEMNQGEIKSEIREIDKKFSELKWKLNTNRNEPQQKVCKKVQVQSVNHIFGENLKIREQNSFIPKEDKQDKKYSFPKFDNLFKMKKQTACGASQTSKYQKKHKYSQNLTQRSYKENYYPHQSTHVPKINLTFHPSNPSNSFINPNRSFATKSQYSLSERSSYSYKNKVQDKKLEHMLNQIRNRKREDLEGCDDLQFYRKQRLKTTSNTAQFLKLHKCYSGYSTPTSQEAKNKKQKPYEPSNKNSFKIKTEKAEEFLKKLGNKHYPQPK